MRTRLWWGLTWTTTLSWGLGGCTTLDAAPQQSADARALQAPPITRPMPSGPHAIGRRQEFWIDPVRNRAIPVWFYYPATFDTARAAEPLLRDDGWATLHQEELTRALGAGAAGRLGELRTDARSGAPPLRDGGRVPVLIFAPAPGWLPTDYSVLVEELVSRGVAVILFAAPGDGALVRLPNGGVVAPRANDEGTFERVAGDIRFLRRELALRDADARWGLAGLFDTLRVGAFGHGIGGAAAILAAAEDGRLRAAANLDGDYAGRVLDGGAAQPLLYVTTEPPAMAGVGVERWDDLDRGEQRRLEAWHRVREHSAVPVRARVAGMATANFRDAGLLPTRSVPSSRRHNRPGSIDGARGLALAAALVSEFFADVFSGTTGGLEVVRTTYPEVTLTR